MLKEACWPKRKTVSRIKQNQEQVFEASIFNTVIAECNTKSCTVQTRPGNTIWEDTSNTADNQKSMKERKVWNARKWKLHILKLPSYTLRTLGNFLYRCSGREGEFVVHKSKKRKIWVYQQVTEWLCLY